MIACVLVSLTAAGEFPEQRTFLNRITKAAFDPLNPRAFIVLNGANKMLVIDLESTEVVKEFDFDHLVESIAITPNGRWMYVALTKGHEFNDSIEPQVGYVAAVDLIDLSLHKTMELPIDPADIVATDSGILVIAGGSGQWTHVATFDAASGALIDKTPEIVYMGMQLALHPSQQIVYGTDTQVTPEDIHHFPISTNGQLGTAWNSRYHGEHPMGGDLFILPNGNEVLSRGGGMFTSSANESTDLEFLRSTETLNIRSAAFDTNRSLGVFANGDGVVVFDYATNAVIEYFNLPDSEFVGLVDGQFAVITTRDFSSRIFFIRPRARSASENEAPYASIWVEGANPLMGVGEKIAIIAEGRDIDGSVELLKIFQGNVELTSSLEDRFQFEGVIQPGTNEFLVVAYDNFGAQGTSTVIRVVGNFPPEVRIVEPEESNILIFEPREFAFRVDVTDPDGVDSVNFSVNGLGRGSDITPPYEFRIWITNAGNYYIVAEGIDNLGLRTRVTRFIKLYPPNDQLAQAAAVTATNLSVTISTVKASREKDEPNHAGAVGGKSVWVKWSLPSSPAKAGTLVIDTFGSNFDTLLAVYSAPTETTQTSFGNLTVLAANDDDSAQPPNSRVKFNAFSGQTYYIAIDGSEGVSGLAKLNLSFLAGTVPPNDPASRAMGLAEGQQGIGTNVSATKEPGEPAHGGNAGGASVWWRFTAQAGGTIEVSTQGSDFDTTLAVYTNITSAATDQPVDLNNLRLVTQNDDAADGIRTSLVRFSPQLRVATYWVAIDGYNGAQGDIRIRFTNISTGSAPTNDLFSSASLLSGTAVVTNGSNLRATAETGEPQHSTNRWFGSVWYKWVPTANGPTSVSTKGSDFDTVVNVYAGTNLATLTRVASNDDDPTGLRASAVLFHASAETEYNIAIAGYSFSTGNIVLALNQTPDFQPRLVTRWFSDRRLLLGMAEPSGSVILESSTNLVAWQTLYSFTNADWEVTVRPSLQGAQQFYRTRLAD